MSVPASVYGMPDYSHCALTKEVHSQFH
uniref:Uncharacterized protein n=1 Tax=Anguilla anguilla TaxID=7936 RepID=A0A0E9W224_ANGAN